MSPLARLAVFAVAALASLGGGALLGAAVGPTTDPQPEPEHPTHDEPVPPSTSVPNVTVTTVHDHPAGGSS